MMEGWSRMLGRVLLVFGMLRLPCLCQSHGRHPLPILWIMPITEESRWGNLSVEVLPAVQLALQHLSKQPAPLGNYQLQIHVADSKCDSAIGLKAFFDAIYSGPKYLVIFGGGCPSVTSSIAQSLEGWNLVQLSFAATAPELANRAKYPNFFRTVPSDSAVNLAVVKLLRYYGWRRVAILTQDGQRYSEVCHDLTKQLEAAQIQIADMETFSHDPCGSVMKLRDNDVRIIVGQFDAMSAAKVFCCAYKLNMFGKKYQWIIPGWYKGNWWSQASTSNCSLQHVLAALEASIRVDLQTLSSSSIRGISGRTPEEYEKEYDQRRQKGGLDSSRFHGFAYDGIWVIAKSLARVMEALRYKEMYDIFQNFTVSDSDMAVMILEAMSETNFLGVTGQVTFQDGERMGAIKFSQFQDGRDINIGEYNAITDTLELTKDIIFKGVEPPKDRTIVYPLRRQINTLVYGTLACMTILSVLMASILLIFNTKHRDHWLIKMSCPLMNNLIVLGGMLSSSTILLFGVDGSFVSDEVFKTLCAVRIWILTVGCTTAFGAMFAKIWRVYVIFKNMKMQKKVIEDQRMMVTVCCMLLIDLSILICWQVLDPPKRSVEEYSLVADPQGRDFVIQPFLERCESTHMSLWLGIIYAHKGLIMFFGCFLAWETRSTRILAMNDSSYISMSMCFVCFTSVLGVVASFITQHEPNVQFGVMALAIILCTTGTLCLVFVPKLMIMRSRPETATQPKGVHFSECQMETDCDRVSETDTRSEEEEEEEEGASAANETLTSASHLDIVRSENQHLKMHLTETERELEELYMQLQDIEEMAQPHMHICHVENLVNISSSSNVSVKYRTLPVGLGASMSLLDDINSPDLMLRRLSLQLPILHHAYLPSSGGMDSSSASSLSSPCASPPHSATARTHRVTVLG